MVFTLLVIAIDFLERLVTSFTADGSASFLHENETSKLRAEIKKIGNLFIFFNLSLIDWLLSTLVPYTSIGIGFFCIDTLLPITDTILQWLNVSLRRGSSSQQQPVTESGID